MLMTAPAHADAISTAQDLIKPNRAKLLIQLFYCFWAVAAFSGLSSVVVCTICYVHCGFMIGDKDLLWFIDNWHFIYDQVPQICVVVSVLSMMFGCCFGSFLLGTITTGVIVTCLSFLITATTIGIWISMLRKNIHHYGGTLDHINKVLTDAIKAEEEKN